MNDLLISFIRTAVPTIVGAVAGFLTAKGITLDPSALAGLTAFLSGLFTAVYYLIARFLESKYPKLGFLLGVAKPPTY
jgi:hypothetical protein